MQKNEFYIPPIHWGAMILVTQAFYNDLEKFNEWTESALNIFIRAWVKERNYQPIILHQPLRAYLTSRTKAPPNHSVMFALGREESLARIRKGIAYLRGLIEDEKDKSDFGDMMDMNHIDIYPPRELLDQVFNGLVLDCLKNNYTNVYKR